MFSNHRRSFWFIFLLVPWVSLGCGKKEDRKATFPVTGRVTYQNQNAEGVLVVLHPLDNPNPADWPKGFPRAYTAADGSFQIGTYEAADGAPTGKYVAIMEWRVATNSPIGDTLPEDRLKGRYFNSAKSKYPVNVGQEAVALPTFELK